MNWRGFLSRKAPKGVVLPAKDLHINPLHPELHASHMQQQQQQQDHQQQQQQKALLLKQYKTAVAEQVAKGVGGPAFDKEREAARLLVQVHHVDPKVLVKISHRIMDRL